MKLMIRKYRKERRLTLKELSRLTGYSASFLSLLENHQESPRLETLKRIAFALDVCPKKLIYSCGHIENCENCYYK